MSKYTTEVRFICEQASGLRESKGFNDVNEVISLAIPKIFNFYFPIFDENYREVLETKILKHFYTREIGEETVGLWRLRLNTMLNEIMPYYNKLYESELLEFNPLYSYNLTRTRKTDQGTERNSTSGFNNTSTGYDLFSDTPQGAITDLDSGRYLTEARKTSDSNNGSSNGNDKVNSTENYLENVSGYMGSNASELLQKYRETFLNIDMMVIRDLEVLFFQLW